MLYSTNLLGLHCSVQVLCITICYVTGDAYTVYLHQYFFLCLVRRDLMYRSPAAYCWPEVLIVLQQCCGNEKVMLPVNAVAACCQG